MWAVGGVEVGESGKARSLTETAGAGKAGKVFGSDAGVWSSSRRESSWRRFECGVAVLVLSVLALPRPRRLGSFALESKAEGEAAAACAKEERQTCFAGKGVFEVSSATTGDGSL